MLSEQAGKVLDVMQARENRMVVITDKSVALLRVKVVAFRSTYRLAWSIKLAKIQTVRSEHRLPLPGFWRLDIQA